MKRRRDTAFCTLCTIFSILDAFPYAVRSLPRLNIDCKSHTIHSVPLNFRHRFSKVDFVFKNHAEYLWLIADEKKGHEGFFFAKVALLTSVLIIFPYHLHSRPRSEWPHFSSCKLCISCYRSFYFFIFLQIITIDPAFLKLCLSATTD